ncbi:hypothetical protein M2263_001759 [Providencia alcalifaciens]|nr:hypothetical protein [Providencia alcalifaciens]
MNEQVLENGRRELARECRKQLKKIEKLNDEQSTAILKSFLPQFKLTLTDKHLAKCPANMWLNYCSAQLNQDTFLKEFCSYSIGDRSPLAV